MKLIAIIAITVLFQGARHTFQPGEEVTGLSAVDIADLKACGALEDSSDTEAQAKKDVKADKLAAKEFADARLAVQARQAAIEAPAT